MSIDYADNDKYAYIGEDEELLELLPRVYCAGHNCNYLFFLRGCSHGDTVYLKCPDCDTDTTCASFEEVDKTITWYPKCRSCKNNNEHCDIAYCDTYTTDICGFCADHHTCGLKKPCDDCIEEYGADNYTIQPDGQWVYQNEKK